MRSKARKALWLAIISIITWLAIGGFSGQAFSKISNVQENDNSAFLPESAESTEASKLIVKFSDQSLDLLPTLLIIVGDVNPATNPEKFDIALIFVLYQSPLRNRLYTRLVFCEFCVA